MKTKIVLSATILVMTLIGIGATGRATPISHVALVQSQQSPEQSKTVSGKVTIVMDNSVTLETKADNGDPETRQFSTDGNTKIEGSLMVGVSATVEYHTDETGKNIATRIVVAAQ